MNKVEIVGLSKSYGEIKAVKNLSLSIPAGSIYGFIGPNGAGKSTTIRCILGLLNKDEGRIFLDGDDVDEENYWIKKKIGYLPSEVFLYDDLTVRQLFNYTMSFYKEDLHERTNYLTSKLDIDWTKKIDDLSLGNLKKVGIVLALMHNPEILILDEPTSGLDPLMQNIFFDLLKEEKAKGTTILLSTHVLSEVKKVCDFVSIIKQGEIVKTDTVENLIKETYVIVTLYSKDLQKVKLSVKMDKIVEEEDDKIIFLYSGVIDQLIKNLSKTSVEKILIQEPDIHDIFMHYYE